MIGSTTRKPPVNRYGLGINQKAIYKTPAKTVPYVNYLFSYANHVDNDNYTSDASGFDNITIPQDIKKGDVLILTCLVRNALVSSPISFTEDGGQQWSSIPATAVQNATTFRVFWCTVNSCLPDRLRLKMTSGGFVSTLWIHVFRPVRINNRYDLDQAFTAASGSPNVAVPAQTPIGIPNLSFVVFLEQSQASASVWSISGSGWNNVGTIRSVLSTSMSIAFAYKTPSIDAVSTGIVTGGKQNNGITGVGYMFTLTPNTL